MQMLKNRPEHMLFGNTRVQLFIFAAVVAFLSNLDAIVDSFVHPEIPYFDREHVIVGGIAGLVSAILFGLLIRYTRYLEQALSKVSMLESFLPICSSCKKIRIADADAPKKESWQPIELYISQRTSTEFSHGICPDCLKKIYPAFTEKTMP